MTVKRKPSLLSVVALCLGLAVAAQVQAQTDNQAADRMARYNVVWNSPSKDVTGVMPIGNGDLGAGVYVLENGDLYLLLSKNDAFNYNGDLYKTGKLRVSLNPSPFVSGKPFRQTLDLPTASILIEADGVKFRIWADANRPVYHVEINSPHELAVTAQPEFWKRYDGGKRLDPTPDVRLERGNQVLWYFWVGDRSGYHERLKANAKGAWTIENPEKILPDLFRFNTFGNLLESPGLTVRDGALSGKGKRFDLRIHSLTLQTSEPGKEWVRAMEEVAGKRVRVDRDWGRHCDWWKRFWDRGWIIASDRTVPASEREQFNGECNAKGLRDEPDGAAVVAQSYNMFRFYMGTESRGRYQAKFNGGLFTQQYRIGDYFPFIKSNDVATIKKVFPFATRQADGSWLTAEDYRPWSPYYTGQNQRLLYWPLLMSGDFDLMKPFFDHFWNVLEMRKAITRTYFGHEGAFYRENVNPVTGDDAWVPPPKVKPGEKYKGDWLTFHYTSGLETVAIMEDYVNYTGDIKFRDERLVPFAREILLFFDQHYPRDPNGKLHMEPSQALETWWITINPATDVAGLRFCLDQLLTMKAGTAEDQRRWRRFRAEIPEVPMRTVEGRSAIAPAQEWDKNNANQEIPEIYPVFPFRCYGFALGSKDLVEQTMEHRFFKDTFGGKCWTQDQIGWAMAGNAQEAARGLVRRFRYATTSLRFPVYGNETTDGIPDLDHFGSGSIALQRMLAQEGNGKIYLLPAWPAQWDVDFKLHLSGGTVLTGIVKDGKLVTSDITPKTRKGDVVVCDSYMR